MGGSKLGHGVFAAGVGLALKNRSVQDMFAAGGESPWWTSEPSGFMTMFSAGTFSDNAFPWEFTVPIDAGVEQFTFRIAGITPKDRRELSEPYVLSRANGSSAAKLKIPPGPSTMPRSTGKNR